jgi:hypothetical protein
MLRIIFSLVHLLLMLGFGWLIWWRTAAYPLGARLAILAAFALGVIHARWRRRVASSETERLLRKWRNDSRP